MVNFDCYVKAIVHVSATFNVHFRGIVIVKDEDMGSLSALRQLQQPTPLMMQFPKHVAIQSM